MTDRRPTTFTIVAAALGVFLVCFALLALQARTQRLAAVAAAPPPPRPVLQRRVVVRRVIVHVRPAGEDGGPGRAVAIAVPAPTVTSAPAPATPAPQAAVPAAPLVTRTS